MIESKPHNKYLLPEEAFHALNVLDEKTDALIRKVSSTNSYSSILSREIYYIECELEEFLMTYYEKFSESVFSSANYKPKNDRIFFDEVHLARKSGFSDVSLFEIKHKAKTEEIDKIFRMLSNEIEPGSTESLTGKILYDRIKKLYVEGNIDELFYIKTKMENGKNPAAGMVSKIENLERELKTQESRRYNLEKKKSNLVNSPEYMLYTKYRVFEMNGEEFFAA